MEPTRVVIADDHVMVRQNIRKILNKSADIEVIGEASNGMEALDLVEDLAPDVLLLDMEMPVMNGIEVVEELAAANSPVRVLVLSAYNDRYYIDGVLQHGAAGYLIKDEAPQAILEAVRKVARGKDGLFSERVAELISEG
jgi:DNA-binding NarL/FixJ family response regulator